MVDFNITEYEEQNSINFEIIVKDLQGVFLDRAFHQNISVN